MSECMKSGRLVLALAVLFPLMIGCGQKTQPDAITQANTVVQAEMVCDIPYMPGIAVDGKDDDWTGGYRVDLLTPPDGALRKTDDHSVRVRLAWNDKGLLMLAHVQDDTFVECPDKGMLFTGDAIEVYLAPSKGDVDCVQWCISPGMTSQQPDIRWNFHDGRTAGMKAHKADFVAARTAVGNSYVVEALLPFESLGIEPKMQRELGFQVWVNDVDPGKPQYWASWYPALFTIGNRNNMHRIRLADHPSLATAFRASASHDMSLFETTFSVIALKEQAGRKVAVLDGEKLVASGVLASDAAGRAQCRMSVPMPPPGHGFGKLVVDVEGSGPQPLTLEDADSPRAYEFVFTDLVAMPASVFGGAPLPKMDFEVPLCARGMMGPYELKTTYYDKDYNIVTQADKPGRYGAVTEIKLADGRVVRRFNTLFRMTEDLKWWRTPLKGSLEWPAQTGITPDMVARNQEWLGNFYTWTFAESAARNDMLAVAMAGLYETPADQQADDFYHNPRQRDRQWWVGLKRKLYGYDKVFAKPFERPFKMQGPPARELHEGTLADAGMKDDAASSIDAVLTEWAGDTDEAFAVCVARHGVIVLHKAYGKRDGKPMTVDTTSEMASATKMLSGAMMLTLVDQDMISLDEEAAMYLPALRGIKTNRPLTVRHLYTHTGGVAGMAHWGAEMNDMEERFAVLMPTLNIGKEYVYDGTGMELSCKILEAASGQSLPEFYRTRMLEPMGSSKSRLCRASWDAKATPLEVARVLQMILNKGAYGQYRWFSEETFKQLLPIDLKEKTGVTANYGMGTHWANDNLLSKEAFGHGAASSATIRVDPTLDLVIVMTRNSAGKNFGKYHPKFIEAIVKGIADAPTTMPVAAK